MVPHQSTARDSDANTFRAPPLTRSSTLPPALRSPPLPNPASDRTHLAPEDAIYAGSPPRSHSAAVNRLRADGRLTAAPNGSARSARSRGRQKTRNRSRSRRRKGTFQKLLWVKQSYPDNYTDEDTFLKHLERNPDLKPYDFWPLVADSTVIVQHVCSVIIFVVCFVLIFNERVSPVAVVSWGSIGTVLGWVLWDWWVGQEEASNSSHTPAATPGGHQDENSTNSSTAGLEPLNGLGLSLPPASLPTNSNSTYTGIPRHSHSTSASSIHSNFSLSNSQQNQGPIRNAPYHDPRSFYSPRTASRLSTAKSAILIYSALLGLSPILKSLTKSTSYDSIWAMSCWLMIINVFFFDYGGRPGVQFPASLSTNAALMASTVLASRLPSTEHVFSLTLFSIEVFGLFPVFRRYLRFVSWKGHVALTVLLIMGAGGGVGIILNNDGGWKAAVGGVVMGSLITAFAMGGCSWWLISLQKYKNEIHGPWDPARPIIRRQWDGY